MTGSKKFFQYTTDGGDIYGLLADESNTELVNGTDGDLTTNITYQLPRNVVPRFGVYQDADGRVLKCYCLTITTYNDLADDHATISHDGRTYKLVRKRPELIRLLPIPDDTGLDDGDAT